MTEQILRPRYSRRGKKRRYRYHITGHDKVTEPAKHIRHLPAIDYELPCDPWWWDYDEAPIWSEWFKRPWWLRDDDDEDQP